MYHGGLSDQNDVIRDESDSLSLSNGCKTYTFVRGFTVRMSIVPQGTVIVCKGAPQDTAK